MTAKYLSLSLSLWADRCSGSKRLEAARRRDVVDDNRVTITTYFVRSRPFPYRRSAVLLQPQQTANALFCLVLQFRQHSAQTSYCSPGLVLDQELHSVAEASSRGNMEWSQVIGIPSVYGTSFIDVGLDVLLAIVGHSTMDVYCLRTRFHRHGRSSSSHTRGGRARRLLQFFVIGKQTLWGRTFFFRAVFSFRDFEIITLSI